MSFALARGHGVMLVTARWFLRDFVLRYWGRLTMVTACGMAAASLQAGALSLLHGMFGRASSGGDLTIPLLQIRIDAVDIIPVVSVALFGALGGAALLSYVQSLGVLRLWHLYHLHAMNVVFQEIAGACDRGAADATDVMKSPVRWVLQQSHQLGAFARVVAGSISPLLRFIAFSAFAVSINPELTVLLLLVAVPAGGMTLFFFAREASRATREHAALASEAQQEADRLLAAAAAGDAPVLRPADDGTSRVVRRTSLLVRRIALADGARLATIMISFAILIGYMTVVGGRAPADPALWGQTILYLSALALAFIQLASFTVSVSYFGRFYPAVLLQRRALEAISSAKTPRQFRSRLATLTGPRQGAAVLDDELG